MYSVCVVLSSDSNSLPPSCFCSRLCLICLLLSPCPSALQSPHVPNNPLPPSSTPSAASMTNATNNPRSATPHFQSPPAPHVGSTGDQVSQVTIQPNPAAIGSSLQRGAGSPATPQQAYPGQQPGMQPQVHMYITCTVLYVHVGECTALQYLMSLYPP